MLFGANDRTNMQDKTVGDLSYQLRAASIAKPGTSESALTGPGEQRSTRELVRSFLAWLLRKEMLPVALFALLFKLGDAATTRQVLVKHLICACTGMPRQDMEWLFEYRNETPESALKLLGTMQPTSKFGEVFLYSNLMAAAAGFIGGTSPLRVRYWAEERAAEFVAARLSRG